ncbi:MAG: hypothetical protein IT299_11240, partial [Dehalococcoidia bacterium]|nr:hypothetical protein [Dehalococcoidia bacterium]
DDDDLDFDPVNVRIEDVLLWEFDVVAWAAEFNRRFDIRGPATRLDDRIWQLGTFGSASLVFLILAHSDSVTEALLRSLPTVRGVPPVVLLPSRTTAPEFGTIGGALLARLTAGGFGAEPSIEQVIRATPTAGFVEPVPGFRHSADFRSAQWNGQSFSLTPQQAQVVEMLLDAWLNGTPDLGQGYLLDRIGTTANELRFTFRDSPAWGTLVVGGGTRGSFRLAL